MTFSVLFIIVIAILALFAIRGMINGLLRTVLSLAAVIIAIALVWVLRAPVTGLLTSSERLTTAVENMVRNTVTDQLSESLSDLMTVSPTDVTGTSELINKLPLPKDMKESLVENNTVNVYDSLGVDTFLDYLAAYLTRMILSALAILLTLILAVILVAILFGMADLVDKLPVVHTFNTAGGLIVGLILGYLVVQILFLIITVFSGTGWGMSAMGQIEENGFLTYLYNSSAVIKMALGQLASLLLAKAA